ncbi:hypothetical protein DL765_011607 [Monosporascus sp. GIB2]|nr:hypothetical protein DL765_011607 [Monosporascus sp. GIB2]
MPPSPTKTLRRIIAEDEPQRLETLRLAVYLHDCEIKLFGLWDPDARQIEYRNAATRAISTKPIEKEAASDAKFTMVKSWLNECLHSNVRGKKIHKTCPLPNPDYMPTRLVEIAPSEDGGYRLRLRDMQGYKIQRYAALSYCWGGDQLVKSTRSSIEQWRVEISWKELPQTLKDAALVCMKMSINFLWVDALCILQDDQDDKAREIADMPNVYRNSIFTIAASRAGGVHEGFLADRNATDFPGLVFTLAYQCRGIALRGSITLIKTQTEPEPLDRRGWALQERLLSPRTLEFSTRQLRFICQHNPRGKTDGWRLKPESNKSRQDVLGDMTLLQEGFGAIESSKHNTNGPEFLEAMNNWYRLVEVYSRRQLTFGTDKLPAISGLAERYGRVFGDQYCAGIWRSTFARALYWKAVPPLRPRPRKWQAPSWSWASIDGPVVVPEEKLAEMAMYSEMQKNPNLKIGDLEKLDDFTDMEPQVVDHDLQLSNPTFPYGPLVEGAGRLTLRAKLLNAVLAFNQHTMFGKNVVTASAFAKNGSSLPFTILIWFDALENDEDREEPAFLLELSSKFTDFLWASRGLVARKVGDDTFIRVGCYNRTVLRNASENPEDWERRAHHDFCWFNSAPTAIVDIV